MDDIDQLKTYVYTPLGAASDDFRLLRLLPGQDGDTIECELEIYSLASQEDKYTALSYTWGDVTPASCIVINGQKHSVRPNLFNFLQTYRSTNTILTLWVDAVCI
jgi:hypothetical protein